MAAGEGLTVDGPLRLRVSDRMLLILDRDIVTLVTPDYDPGIFFVHVELMEVHVVPKRDRWKVTVKTTGVSRPFQALPFDVPNERIPAFEEFVAEARRARERSLADG